MKNGVTSRVRSFGIRHRLLVSTAIGSVVLFLGAGAFAAIVSGTSTTKSSVQVTVTQLVLDRPSVSAGDVMVASIAVNGGSSAVIHEPTGWTPIGRTDNDTSIALVSYYKVAGGSEPSSYTWTIDGQTTAEGGITPYTGVDTSSPIADWKGNTGFGWV
jgi:hypothetical protein